MVKMTKRRRIDVAKKKRVCCDFCGKSSGNRYETRQHKQEDDESLESKLKRLRLVTRRMTGKDLYGLSYHELQSLRTHLRDAILTVSSQKEKMREAERKQKREAGDKDKELLAPRSSSGEAPRKSKMQIEFERQKAESMESEVERLWLFKERMSGRELGNMNFSELGLLECQMSQALSRMTAISINEVFFLLSV